MTLQILKPHILVVEDDLADQELLRTAIRRAGLFCRLDMVDDGEKAVSFLLDGSSPVPDLVLLDINLPKLDGRQVLRKVGDRLNISNLVIIALSTSNEQDDIKKMYNLGVNAYIQKPYEFEGYVSMVKALHNFWFEISSLPRVGRSKERISEADTIIHKGI